MKLIRWTGLIGLSAALAWAQSRPDLVISSRPCATLTAPSVTNSAALLATATNQYGLTRGHVLLWTTNATDVGIYTDAGATNLIYILKGPNGSYSLSWPEVDNLNYFVRSLATNTTTVYVSEGWGR
jgi:hypothetical protein